MRLLSGNVLVAGGTTGGASYWPTNTVEIYEVRSGLWVDAGRMSIARWHHTVTLLGSGRVLIAGGSCAYGPDEQLPPCDGALQSSAEMYDPATDSWGVVAAMAQARESHTATLLPSGRVLVVGGTVDGWIRTATVEEYTP